MLATLLLSIFRHLSEQFTSALLGAPPYFASVLKAGALTATHYAADIKSYDTLSKFGSSK